MSLRTSQCLEEGKRIAAAHGGKIANALDVFVLCKQIMNLQVYSPTKG
jgi:hypothetical protein